MQNLGTILGIWAHPDDENYLSGGIMALAVEAGSRVVCATATKGEKGSWDEGRWPAATMGEVRAAELSECLRLLGITEHHWLDYIDGECDQVPTEEGIGKVEALIRDIQPDTVLTFGLDGMTGHPDHIAVAEWTIEAFRRAAPPGATLHFATKTPEWAEAYVKTMNEFDVFAEGTPPITPREECSIHLTCEGELAERKWQAALAQTSQIEVLFDAWGQDFARNAIAEESFRLAN